MDFRDLSTKELIRYIADVELRRKVNKYVESSVDDAMEREVDRMVREGEMPFVPDVIDLREGAQDEIAFDLGDLGAGALGVLHTAGGTVLSAFGAGGLAKSLETAEGSALPDWARNFGGSVPSSGGQQQQGAEMVSSPDYIVVVHTNGQSNTIPSPSQVVVRGGNRFAGNGYQHGESFGRRFSFGYDAPSSVEITKSGSKVTMGDVKQILFCGGTESPSVGCDIDHVIGLDWGDVGTFMIDPTGSLTATYEASKAGVSALNSGGGSGPQWTPQDFTKSYAYQQAQARLAAAQAAQAASAANHPQGPSPFANYVPQAITIPSFSLSAPPASPFSAASPYGAATPGSQIMPTDSSTPDAGALANAVVGEMTRGSGEFIMPDYDDVEPDPMEVAPDTYMHGIDIIGAGRPTPKPRPSFQLPHGASPHKAAVQRVQLVVPQTTAWLNKLATRATTLGQRKQLIPGKLGVAGRHTIIGVAVHLTPKAQAAAQKHVAALGKLGKSVAVTKAKVNKAKAAVASMVAQLNSPATRKALASVSANVAKAVKMPAPTQVNINSAKTGIHGIYGDEVDIADESADWIEIVGQLLGADVSGLNPGDPNYDPSTDPNDTTGAYQAAQGTPTPPPPDASVDTNDVPLPTRNVALTPDQLAMPWPGPVPSDGIQAPITNYNAFNDGAVGSYNVFFGNGHTDGSGNEDGFKWRGGGSAYQTNKRGNFEWTSRSDYPVDTHSAAAGWGPMIGNPNDPQWKNLQWSIADQTWFWQSDNAPTWATQAADHELAVLNQKTKDAAQATADAAAAAQQQEQDAEAEAKAKQDAANALAQSAADTQANIANQALSAQQAQADLQNQQLQQQQDAAQAQADLQAQQLQQQQDAAQAKLDLQNQAAQNQLDTQQAQQMLDYFRDHPEAMFSSQNTSSDQQGNAPDYGGGNDYGDDGSDGGDSGQDDVNAALDEASGDPTDRGRR